MIAAPDKRFTFDAQRPETSVDELHRYFLEGRIPGPADYEDISRYVNTGDLALPEDERRLRLKQYCDRREHLSVWTSTGFRQFWTEALKWASVAAEPIYEVNGDRNQFEYFGVWQKR